ncbi:DUF6491 family protein [Pseudoalteromonas shioyasakiensis]|uniref:DUF6491 family protein n=1 Tax=Pseudoalteromonas shioyasakiensis TaxID=1190813 RepID=UPI0021189AF1|nr:DUF6491 family protein [Pseudoalteromonas shioyasakiensis]MCQ8876480.1 DUF6491 family protein [Pseudoalteromonas shioyasakiensis]
MKNIFTIALISVFTMGCTSTTMSLSEKDIEYGQFVINENLSSEDSVQGFKFSGWKSLSDNYLIITAVHDKDYLIQTNGTCIDLNNSHDIQINRTSSLAIYKQSDSISRAGNFAGKCNIKSIYPISNEQTDELVSIGKTFKSES